VRAFRRWIFSTWVVALGLSSLALGAVADTKPVSTETRTHVVVIENMGFTPAPLEIHAGERVTFNNSDLVPHTATTKGKSPFNFDSGPLKPGESWTVRPEAEGTLHYACIFHPMMEGVIVVKP